MNFKSHFDDNDSPSITTRRLTKSTAERYGVTSDSNNYYFPYYDDNGTLVAAKVRNKQEKKLLKKRLQMQKELEERDL